MNIAELVAKIAEGADIAKTRANAALDAFTTTVTETLKNVQTSYAVWNRFAILKLATSGTLLQCFQTKD